MLTCLLLFAQSILKCICKERTHDTLTAAPILATMMCKIDHVAYLDFHNKGEKKVYPQYLDYLFVEIIDVAEKLATGVTHCFDRR